MGCGASTSKKPAGQMTASADLRSRNLSSLPKGLDLSHSVSIWLSQNLLEALADRDVETWVCAECVYLNGNRLHAVPEGLCHLPRLRKLYLGQNRIAALPEAIGAMGALEELKLDRNCLTTLPASFGSLSHLKDLDLSTNTITVLPPQINGLVGLMSLDLDGNRGVMFPPNLRGLRALERLSVASAGLSAVQSEIGHLVNLSFADFSKNSLSALPKEFGSLSRLVELVLPNNHFKVIPDVIGQLASLRVLWMANNEIEAIPDSIGNLKSLVKLYLYNNNISSVSPEIGKLLHLEVLELYSNRLESLPPTVGGLTSLRELRLKDNFIAELPAGVGDMKELANLDLRNNRLTRLPPELCRCRLLTRLVLANNPIEADPEWRKALDGGVVGVLAHLRTALYGTDPEAVEVEPPQSLQDLPTSLGSFSVLRGAPPVLIDSRLLVWVGIDDMDAELRNTSKLLSGDTDSSYYCRSAVVPKGQGDGVAAVPDQYDDSYFMQSGVVDLRRVGNYRHHITEATEDTAAAGSDAGPVGLRAVTVAVERMPTFDHRLILPAIPLDSPEGSGIIWLSTYTYDTALFEAQPDGRDKGQPFWVSLNLVHLGGQDALRSRSASYNEDEDMAAGAPAAASGLDEHGSSTPTPSAPPMYSSSSVTSVVLPASSSTSVRVHTTRGGASRGSSPVPSEEKHPGSAMWSVVLHARGDTEHRLVQPNAPSFRRYVVMSGHRIDLLKFKIGGGTKWGAGRPGILDPGPGHLAVPNLAVAIRVTVNKK